AFRRIAQVRPAIVRHGAVVDARLCRKPVEFGDRKSGRSIEKSFGTWSLESFQADRPGDILGESEWRESHVAKGTLKERRALRCLRRAAENPLERAQRQIAQPGARCDPDTVQQECADSLARLNGDDMDPIGLLRV